MTKDEFLSKEMPDILPYTITLEKHFYEPCVVGAYLERDAWTVYKTDKNGKVEIIRHTRDENSAFEFLYREVLSLAKHLRERKVDAR